jgi:hypothetical protein
MHFHHHHFDQLWFHWMFVLSSVQHSAVWICWIVWLNLGIADLSANMHFWLMLSITNWFAAFQPRRISRFHLTLKLLARHVFPIVNHSHQFHLNPIHDWLELNPMHFHLHHFDQLWFHWMFVLSTVQHSAVWICWIVWLNLGIADLSTNTHFWLMLLITNWFAAFQHRRNSRVHFTLKLLARHVFPGVNHSHQFHLNPIHD